MNVATTLILQSFLLHLMLAIPAAVWSYRRLIRLRPVEAWLFGLCLFVPLIGPILLVAYTLMATKRV